MINIDEVIRTKRRSIALIVEHDGRLIVRAPMHAKDEKILEFVHQKEKWILNKQEKAKALYPPFAPKEYVNGEGFWYLGKTHPLQWTENQKPLLSLNENFQLSQMAAYKAPIVFEKWYRGQAYKIISEQSNGMQKNMGSSINTLRSPPPGRVGVLAIQKARLASLGV